MRTRSSLSHSLSILLLLVGVSASAQPAARMRHVMVYDSSPRDQMLIFGGSNASGDLRNDVWTLHMAASPYWSQVIATGTPPSARVAASGIYDPVGHRFIVFGGYGPSGLLNDVWALSLSGPPVWAQIVPTGSAPAPRHRHGAIYDPVRQRMLIFGGEGDAVSGFNDVWGLSLTGAHAWTQVLPVGTPPSARRGSGVAYDAVRDRMIVFGGTIGAFSPLSDLWALTLAGTPTWLELTPAGTAPPRREFFSFATDAAGDRAVLHGGYEYLGSGYDDVWSIPFSPTGSWAEIQPAGTAPETRYNHAASLDPLRNRMILFGGGAWDGPGALADLWSLNLTNSPAWGSVDAPFEQAIAGVIQATTINKPYESTPVLRGLPGVRVSVRRGGEVVGIEDVTSWPAGTFELTAPLQSGDQLTTVLANMRTYVADRGPGDLNCNTLGNFQLSKNALAGTGQTLTWPVMGAGTSGDAVNVMYLGERFATDYWENRLGRPPQTQWRVQVQEELAARYGAGATSPMPGGKSCSSFEPGAPQFGDIVFHEFGHRMIVQTALDYIGKSNEVAFPQAAGMDEGLADYFTAAYTDDPKIQGLGNKFLRDLEQPVPALYNPCGAAFTADSYYGARVFGGALWDMRKNLTQEGADADEVDTMVYDAIATLVGRHAAADRTFLRFMEILLEGPLGQAHQSDIRDAFSRHNISATPQQVCTESPVIQAVHRTVSGAGQAFEVVWSRVANARFYRVWARPFGGSGGLALGQMVADSLADSSMVWVEPDTTQTIAFVVTAMDSSGIESPASQETPAVTAVEASPSSPERTTLRVMRNPSNGIVELTLHTSVRDRGRVAVHDITGRLVRVLWQGELDPEQNLELVWDGLDRRGSRVDAGVYFLKASLSGSVTARRVVLLR